MKMLRAAACLAVIVASGCVTTSGEPRPTGEPPSTGAFQYPYNARW